VAATWASTVQAQVLLHQQQQQQQQQKQQKQCKQQKTGHATLFRTIDLSCLGRQQ